MDFICLCVRIPKCGSTSLSNSLESLFADRQVFRLPHTLDLEGGVSHLQRLRFYRSQFRNLLKLYGTASLTQAYKEIGQRASNGDLISGGHIDFASVRQNIERPIKIITLFRNPIARCYSEYTYCRRTYLAKPAISRFDMPMKHKTAGRFCFNGYLDFLIERAETYENLAARYIGWNGRQRLDEFFSEHVFHSGVLEDSGSFALGLSRKLGKPLFFRHDNRSNDSAPSIGAAERAKIESLYPRDFELYEWQLSQTNSVRSRRKVLESQAARPASMTPC